MSDDFAQSWQRIRSELRHAVTDSIFHLWLEPLTARHIDQHSLIVEAPDEIRSWVSDRFGRLLSACATKAIGRPLSVKLVAPDPDQSPQASNQTGQTYQHQAPLTAASFQRNPLPTPPSVSEPVNPRFTFDQFVIGDSNRLAHGAALAVAEMPGLAYNPLFICGKPGLGKTHLLHSIANYVTSYGDDLTVRYTTVETFTNQFLGALQGGNMDAFKHLYRDLDVLLIDDVQFLQSKLKTEQEFFHTFNALYTAGAQIVLTSDRPPRDMEALEDRLRERFEAGLVTDVQPPDFDMRLTILRKRVQQDGLTDLDTDALHLIANTVSSNVRALEGALIRVVAFSSLTGRRVTAKLAEEVLAGLYPQRKHAGTGSGKPRIPNLVDIQNTVSTNFNVQRQDLLSSSRSPELMWPRQVAMYLSRELTEETLPTIGREFGGRAHTTVMNAHRRVTRLLATSADTYSLIEKLTKELVGTTNDRSA